MIDLPQSPDQLPNEIKPAFQQLNVLKHLRDAGFKKKFGFTCAYLFRLVFLLQNRVPHRHSMNEFAGGLVFLLKCSKATSVHFNASGVAFALHRLIYL